MITILFSLSLFLHFPLQEILEVFFQPIPEVRMLAFGDLMLGRDIARLMEEKGSDYPFEKIFGPEGIDINEYDLVTANLEGPIYSKLRRKDLFPEFSFDPEVAPQLLKKYGFNLLNLANNHTWDKGLKGWESTLKALHDVGIATVGHPKNLFESDIYETTINGIRLGFIGISDTLKIFSVDWEEAKKKVRELKSRNHFVILMIHWGKEFQTISTEHQRDKGHGMIDAGVDLIIGHHPHVVQESEIYQGKYIYYSLGNFVFDQYFSKEAQKGLGLDIHLQFGGKVRIKEIPLILRKGQPQLDN